MLVTDARDTEPELTSARNLDAARRNSREPGSASFEEFQRRHIGPSPEEAKQMLKLLGFSSVDALIDAAVPQTIRSTQSLAVPAARTEMEVLNALREIASQNQVYRSLIGMGYYDCITPPVIQRCLFENPGWYTQYTPYQAEISQGRLEALLSFQTMVCDLTGLDIANASLLDEGTAAAEAMALARRVAKSSSMRFLVDAHIHPQTLAVLCTRAEPLGW